MRQGVLISSHRASAQRVLLAWGIDNVGTWKSTTWKFPIVDGSGLPFVRLIEEAGIHEYRRKRRYFSHPPCDLGLEDAQGPRSPSSPPIVSALILRYRTIPYPVRTPLHRARKVTPGALPSEIASPNLGLARR